MKTTSFILGLMFLTNISTITFGSFLYKHNHHTLDIAKTATTYTPTQDSLIHIGRDSATYMVLICQEGTKKALPSYSMVASMTHIAKLEGLTKAEMLKRFNRIPADFGLKVTFDSEATLLTLQQFYTKYHISKEQRQLPFYVDNKKYDTSKLIVICEEDLKDIQITDSYIKLVLK